MRVCSTSHLFHYFFADDEAARDSVLQDGIRPLSDFPDSERWQQIEAELPGFYERLYEMIGAPVLGAPYANSGIFVTPIDFRLLPGSFLHDKPRFNIPIDRIDPGQSVLTYVIDEERMNLPLTAENIENAAALWDDELVSTWFGVDPTKAFFYVPQVAAYQGRIDVAAEEFDTG